MSSSHLQPNLFCCFLISWTISARVTFVSDVISWENTKGSGTLFSIDLLDSSQNEIKATFFKEACTKFEPIIKLGQVRFILF